MMKNAFYPAIMAALMGVVGCGDPANAPETTTPTTAGSTVGNPNGGVTMYATSKYGGTYSFGDDAEKGSVGHLSVYPASDTSMLFYLDVNKGAPSYNMGMLFGRMVMNNGTAFYFKKEDYQKQGCKLQFSFQDNAVLVTTVKGFEECEFGNGVVADNTYAKKDSSIPAFFISAEGDTIQFSNATPEN